MRAWPLLVLLVAACSSPPPAPAPDPQAPACHLRPLSISTHDQLTPATLREIRRVNRELRRFCAG
ncbi:hypothetical protein [Roseococcus pinisoli]|uniref:Uncharacterized protein n=1 Tax=Roseococcus pinisoli TaxID=2835040 RepID=A0ABS5QC55_9PROT|nr:hypothetical protein [Roseococcus pinisoli]MBS7810545.1 hypothetical protein [Roseococcus pinisoli]